MADLQSILQRGNERVQAGIREMIDTTPRSPGSGTRELQIAAQQDDSHLLGAINKARLLKKAERKSDEFDKMEEQMTRRAAEVNDAKLRIEQQKAYADAVKQGDELLGRQAQQNSLILKRFQNAAPETQLQLANQIFKGAYEQYGLPVEVLAMNVGGDQLQIRLGNEIINSSLSSALSTTPEQQADIRNLLVGGGNEKLLEIVNAGEAAAETGLNEQQAKEVAADIRRPTQITFQTDNPAVFESVSNEGSRAADLAQLTSLEDSSSVIQRTIDLIEANPDAVGFQTTLPRLARNTLGNITGALNNFAEMAIGQEGMVGNIANLAAQSAREIDLLPREEQNVVNRFFQERVRDPKYQANASLAMLETVLAYKMAKALDSNGRLSDADVRNNRIDLTSVTADPQEALGLLRERQSMMMNQADNILNTFEASGQNLDQMAVRYPSVMGQRTQQRGQQSTRPQNTTSTPQTSTQPTELDLEYQQFLQGL